MNVSKMLQGWGYGFPADKHRKTQEKSEQEPANESFTQKFLREAGFTAPESFQGTGRLDQ